MEVVETLLEVDDFMEVELEVKIWSKKYFFFQPKLFLLTNKNCWTNYKNCLKNYKKCWRNFKKNCWLNFKIQNLQVELQFSIFVLQNLEDNFNSNFKHLNAKFVGKSDH